MASKVSILNRRRFLDDSGYSLFWYSGKMKDAPSQLRHILRDFQAGYYVINARASLAYPLGVAPDDLTASALNDWYATEAFYIILAHMLAKRGWVFFSKSDKAVTIADLRPDKRWDSTAYQTYMRQYPDENPNGFYAVNETRKIGPVPHDREAIEAAAIEVELLDGYYSNEPMKVGLPFNGKLRPVNMAQNAYGLMTDQNQMIATVMASGQGDILANARMLALAPDMLVLIDQIAMATPEQLNEVTDELVKAAANIHQQVFDSYEP